MKNVVWKASVDQKTWDCLVVGHPTESSEAFLMVRDKDKVVVHSEQVGLAYGAVFGPDADDVAQWTHRCLDVIDFPEKRTRAHGEPVE